MSEMKKISGQSVRFAGTTLAVGVNETSTADHAILDVTVIDGARERYVGAIVVDRHTGDTTFDPTFLGSMVARMNLSNAKSSLAVGIAKIPLSILFGTLRVFGAMFSQTWALMALRPMFGLVFLAVAGAFVAVALQFLIYALPVIVPLALLGWWLRHRENEAHAKAIGEARDAMLQELMPLLCQVVDPELAATVQAPRLSDESAVVEAEVVEATDAGQVTAARAA